MTKKLSAREISLGVSELYVSEADGGSWTASLETIQTAALLDIARSLRDLLALARCPNVGAGFRAMETSRKILARMDRRRKKSPRSKR
jgi:hypothetical protein